MEQLMRTPMDDDVDAPSAPQTNARTMTLFALVAAFGAGAVATLTYLHLNDRLNSVAAEVRGSSRSMSESVETKLAGLQQRLEETEKKLGLLQGSVTSLEASGKVVDLSKSRAQDVGDGFVVSRLTVEPHGTGVMVGGRIINTKSVRHEDARFKLTIGQHSGEFEIAALGPGNGVPFEVEMTDVVPASAREARIAHVRSTIAFFTD